MIREKAILFKLNQINISDGELMERLNRPTQRDCPACGASKSCTPYGSYDRDLISIMNGIRVEKSITIQRVKCSSCGNTHAILPDLLVPYASYSLRFILHILRAYLIRTECVAILCETFSISVSTLYRWIHLFRLHANLWLSALEQFSWVNTSLLDTFENLEAFPQAFFKKYRFSFLQNSRKTTSNNYLIQRRG